MMNKRIIFLICAILCLFFVLCSCSCEDETVTPTSSSVQSSNTGGGGGDNQKPVACKHDYWFKPGVNKSTSSDHSAILFGECYNCGDSLTKEVVTVVTFDEWKAALSPEKLTSFTLCVGQEYTDYALNGSLSRRVKDGIYTEDYFLGAGSLNSKTYAEEAFTGYAMLSMYEQFTYDKEKKVYVLPLNESSSIEIGFADGYVLSLATVSKNGHEESRITSYYINHGKVEVNLPSYFYTIYNGATSLDEIKNSSLSQDMCEKIVSVLDEMSFDNRVEVSFLENGGLSVYFYLDEAKTDPLFGEEYSFVTVVIQDTKLKSVSFGNNTVEIK